MTAEQDLREKLRKIEALFAGAATAGEKAAAGAAAERIRARLGKAAGSEAAVTSVGCSVLRSRRSAGGSN